jgi:ribosomal protein S12 methylthiotransferase
MAKRNPEQNTSVGFIALGCPKNIVDSEKMLAIIGQAGFLLSSDVDNADVVVINTCGFIKPAKDEALKAIRTAADQKKKGKVKRIIVAGCLSQRMGQQLADEVEGIDAIVGLAAREIIDRVVREAVTAGPGKKSCRMYLDDGEKQPSDDRGRLLITPQHWAYLRISEGCDRKCSFCTIPAIRGRFRSKKPQLVLAEAKELAGNGAVELSIIAQDSNYYGRDLGLENGLCGLIRDLEGIDGLEWIRLMYLYPAAIDAKLIETIAASNKVVNYIDMPIQHVNDEILRKMRRSERKESITALIENLRTAMPDVVLRTTIIVGFPGETQEQFEELLDFIRWAQFDAMGCFTFYPETLTPAAQMAGQVPQDVKNRRADTLMRLQQEIAFSKGQKRLAGELICLIDEVDDKGGGKGRFNGQAPHIDSICHIRRCLGRAGEFVRTKVVETSDYDLVVEQI